MSSLITISGVRGYIDETGTAQLNLEDVARGLGFARIATSGNEVVRWETVARYLTEFGACQQVGTNAGKTFHEQLPEFIPENIFYRLAMKAKNETAEKFQALVANEILPTIRKTGTYSVPKPLRTKQSVPRVKPAVKDALDTAKLLESIGVKPGIAQSACFRAVEKNCGVDLTEIVKCLPPAEHEIGSLNATGIAERLNLRYKTGSPDAKTANRMLIAAGLIEISGEQKQPYRLTEKGKEFGEFKPYTRGGHSGYDLCWNESVLNVLSGQPA